MTTKQIENAVARAKEHTKELWEAYKAVEATVEIPRQEWYRAHQDLEVLEAAVERIHNLEAQLNCKPEVEATPSANLNANPV